MKRIILLLVSYIVILQLSAQFTINEEPAVLETSSGNIYGTLKVPADKKTMPLAIFISGSGPTDRNGNVPTMTNNSLKMLSDGLYYSGIATLSFDKRGLSESSAALANESDIRFDNYIDDVKEWINKLASDKRFSEIIVVGHSEGSLIGMIASADNKKVSKYVSIAGAGESAGEILREQLGKQLAGQPETVKENIFSYITKLEQGETIPDVPQSLYSLFRPDIQPYMISWFKYNPQTEIAKLSIPVLIIQGTTDIQVTTSQAEMLAKANPKAKIVIIENMNHVLKDCDSLDQTTQIKTTYMDSQKPINTQLIKEISDFILDK